VGAHKVVPAVWALVEDADSERPDTLRPRFAEAGQEIREIEARVKQVERRLEALAEQLPAVALLLTIPGIGLQSAPFCPAATRCRPGDTDYESADAATAATGLLGVGG
jgi:hypothetical protein